MFLLSHVPKMCISSQTNRFSCMKCALDRGRVHPRVVFSEQGIESVMKFGYVSSVVWRTFASRWGFPLAVRPRFLKVRVCMHAAKINPNDPKDWWIDLGYSHVWNSVVMSRLSVSVPWQLYTLWRREVVWSSTSFYVVTAASRAFIANYLRTTLLLTVFWINLPQDITL